MNSRGFTLLELLISITMFGVVLVASLSALDAQSRGFRKGLARMEAMQSLRYAVQSIETTTYTAGTNVPPGQPSIVYAGSDRLAFHADYASNQPGDLSATFVEPGAPNGQVYSPITPVTIPGTSFTHPSTAYKNPDGSNSPAELIILFFEPDTSTARTDDYALFRQVNRGAPELLARRLLKSGSTPFFEYLREPSLGDAGSPAFSGSQLPLVHTVHEHASVADTGATARPDSVRAIRVTLGATNDRPGADERITQTIHVIRLPNTRYESIAICGDMPLLGTGIVATPGLGVGGVPQIQLDWAAATDETTGELDVVRYVVWRKQNAAVEWGDPFLSVPAGQSNYLYVDSQIQSDTTYQYALAAQDCTPMLSDQAYSAAVIAP